MADSHEPTRSVLVARDRLPGWVERFSARHGEPVVSRADDTVTLSAPDGAVASYDDVEPPEDFGLVLVRRGGYAIGRVEGGVLVAHKTGTRYVQGTTKAGGWSQKRYARRRANQADALAGAAAEQVDRLLPHRLPVHGGGDRSLVTQVLMAAGREPAEGARWLDVKEPRLTSLRDAVRAVQSIEMRLNPEA